MKRVQLFEFEDFKSFPSVWRSTMTKLLVQVLKVFGMPEALEKIILKVKMKHQFDTIVDMGSGAGGAMPIILEKLNEGEDKTRVILTDLHPNKKFVEEFNTHDRPNITYSEDPLDASDLNNAPNGLKTMINSFHHMPPPVAKQILKTAQDNQQPILIYEMGINNIASLVWWLMLPISLPMMAIMSLFLVFKVKPLKFPDILFTWIVPVVPIFYAWDGQASLPRMYTFDDIKNDLLPEKSNNYTWEIEYGYKGNGKKQGYYILGLPKN